MRTVSAALALLVLTACADPSADSRFSYPDTRADDQVDHYHGTAVPDPYRWLEDDLSEETAAWVAEQNELTFGYLRSLPARAPVLQRLTELWDYEKVSPPTRRGGRWFFTRNDGLQNQSVLFVREAQEESARVLLDPNTLSEDGTMALSSTETSEDGNWLAYAISEAGSDWQTWRVRDVATGRDTADELRWLKNADVSWTHDHRGFFYSRFPAPEGSEFSAVNRDNKLYYHRLGDPQSEDRLVHERPDKPDWGFDATVTVDGRWVSVVGYEGTARLNRLGFIDLEDPEWALRPLFDDFDAAYSYVGNVGETWFIRTTNGASRGRVITIDIQDPAGSFRELIPETEDTLTTVQFLGGRLVCHYLHNAHSSTLIYGTDGELDYEVNYPALGTVRSYTGNAADSEAFYAFTSFTWPGAVFRIDLETGESQLDWQPEVAFDPASFETEQVWYNSKDGTRIPMFLVHKAGVEPDGDLPVMLYGYGGFNISLTPRFSITNTVWMEMGGVYAMPNLRGGGEFGREWHEAGTIHSKQNVFDDFIAAAEWLIDNGWTRPERLAIRGGSNGGLLVGACMTQRPDLFGACLPAVGVLDMLRYHEFTIGWAWASDYGTSADPAQFETLLAYSPLHNLRPGTHYPATLITTGDHDDRVVPAHSFKFAATLQRAQAGPAPTLIRIETRAGHGAGKPTGKIIEEYADTWAFLAESLGMPTPQF